MKIQCDVCNKAAATVFCVADDAALCSDCDRSVHHANKLAGKHQRFSLLNPKQTPLCDICQEKRAFLFCQQDRAILCRDCDFSIHKVNEHKQTHNRFLLTGTKLSVESAVYSSAAADKSPTTTETTYLQPNLVTPTNYTTSPAPENGGGIVNLPISDYLIETLPGWHVDDFLDFSSSPFDFGKGGDLLMGDGGAVAGGRNECTAAAWSSENLGIWVPQASSPPLHPSQYTVIPQPNVALGGGGGGGGQINCGRNIKESKNLSKSMGKITKEGKSTVRKRVEDWSFTVPQISPQSLGSKRSRFAG
ncbi:B-box zinc finger protein 21-like [Impatiens glandulifera]|uniref:B-box zinc finger protein 21-like n=1 Tax=Impatiens glandulifera TaxID=253017 RepID=UPI001FB13133|nr:B-box zinc finger protein 21-like [Impatiens glandulifera]